MSWIIITATDLNDYLVGVQAAAIRTVAVAAGQTDRFTAVMPDVSSRIRNEILSCSRNRLDATANSIPPELKTVACLLIVEAMQSGIPGLELSEDQRTLIRDARDYLKRIARCEIAVSSPAVAVDPPNIQSFLTGTWGSQPKF